MVFPQTLDFLLHGESPDYCSNERAVKVMNEARISFCKFSLFGLNRADTRDFCNVTYKTVFWYRFRLLNSHKILFAFLRRGYPTIRGLQKQNRGTLRILVLVSFIDL